MSCERDIDAVTDEFELLPAGVHFAEPIEVFLPVAAEEPDCCPQHDGGNIF